MTPRCDVAIVGAGFAGLYMLHRARELGLTARVFERGGGIGGVWYFNRYPGARCDVESVDYSYSFSEALQQEWSWTERYASQPEILRYVEHVADRFGLREDISLNTEVTALRFDEDASVWHVHGTDAELAVARFCVMATGSLSQPKTPALPGLERFEGGLYHTATWPDEEVDFAAKRVGVIGTGSSGTQVIPVVAERAAHLHVFQRTPNFTVPAQHAPMDEAFEREVKATYPERRELQHHTTSGLARQISRRSALEASASEREAVYEDNWSTAGFGFILCFSDLLLDRAANDTAVGFIHRKIDEQVSDPAVAELLKPTDHPYGTKRPPVASDYYPTFNRDDVTLVDLRAEPIEEVIPNGVRTSEREIDLDVLIVATGFDALVGALNAIDVRGRDGHALRDSWAEGPRTYLGLAVAGFPNLFTITGPGSPSVLGNMVIFIEQHVDWIADLLEHARREGIATVDARVQAQDAWVAHVNELADATLYPQARSWYLTRGRDASRVFMPYPGGLRRYRRRCDEVAAAGYEGFSLTFQDTPAGARASRNPAGSKA